MNTDIKDHFPDDFDDNSRVWVYQSNRLLSLHEALQIEELLKNFVSNWNSHGTPVKGYANLFFGQFIVLAADETGHGVSGCSTDSSVRMMKDIEQMFNINLFDRLLLGFLVKERVQMVPMAQLAYALENKFLDSSTIYFNNTVQTLGELKTHWLVPIRQSWLAKDPRFSNLLATETELG
jgi:hypothetical protein